MFVKAHLYYPYVNFTQVSLGSQYLSEGKTEENIHTFVRSGKKKFARFYIQAFHRSISFGLSFLGFTQKFKVSEKNKISYCRKNYFKIAYFTVNPKNIIH